MKDLLIELMKKETELVLKYRAKGETVIKPSTLALILIGIFYVLSPIDIIPEQFIKPKAFGYVDDLAIVAMIIATIYGDVIEAINSYVPSKERSSVNEKVQPERVQESGGNDQSTVILRTVGHDDEPLSVPPSDSSEWGGDREQPSNRYSAPSSKPIDIHDILDIETPEPIRIVEDSGASGGESSDDIIGRFLRNSKNAGLEE